MKLQIIFATGNADKVREVSQILNDPEIRVFTMKEAGLSSDPEENGSTFEENALIKASAVGDMLIAALSSREHPIPCLKAGIPVVVMSDDSGLVIDALNGEPGIYSARYLGRETPYPEKMRLIMEKMKNAEGRERSARFVDACACVVPPQYLKPGLPLSPTHPSDNAFVVRGVMEGEIGREIAGEFGFGYDPFFYLPEYGMSSAAISPDEKNRISHRGKAFRAMMSLLEEVLL